VSLKSGATAEPKRKVGYTCYDNHRDADAANHPVSRRAPSPPNGEDQHERNADNVHDGGNVVEAHSGFSTGLCFTSFFIALQ
jgi:hypothetical protein